MSEILETPAPEATSTPTGTVLPAASDQPAQITPQAGEAPPKEPQQQTTDEQPEKRGKNHFERRLSRAYRREAEAKARADLLEKRLAEIEAKAAPKTEVAGEPKLSDFDDIEKYAAAKAEYREKKAIEAYEAKQRQEQAKSQQQRIVSEWAEKAERGSDKYDDWDDVVGEIKPTNPMTVALMRAENADDVAYHLGKNLKEASRIAGLDPISQMLAIGALSAKLQADPPKPKQPSKAPAPITPVSGKSEAPSEELKDDDDMKTFIKKRNRQLGRVALK